MARLSINDKIRRTARFLVGLRSRRIAQLLHPYGFTDTARKEGWNLTAAAAGADLSFDAPTATPSLLDDALERLDAIENRWFPIAKATLQRHAPDDMETVFLNLRQTSGVEVALSMRTFVDRIEALDSSTRELLANRGLNDAVIAETRALLGQVQGESTTPPDDELEESVAAEREAVDLAVDRMWAWYLEWSAIARAVITNGRYLQLLGFRTGSSSSDSTKTEADDDVDAPSEEDVDVS